eukprot:1339144-Rhodomonas_salina.1
MPLEVISTPPRPSTCRGQARGRREEPGGKKDGGGGEGVEGGGERWWEREGEGRGRKEGMGGKDGGREGVRPVSYTHLTLPTICSV